METKKVIDALLKAGAKRINGLKVRNVTISREESYTRIGLSTDTEIDGFLSDENGVYTPGKTTLVFVSSYSIASQFKDNDDTAFAANHIVEHPEALQVLLSRATFDVIQETVKAGDSWKNPWSDSGDERTYDHDTIINHVINIRLSAIGNKMLEALAMKLLIG